MDIRPTVYWSSDFCIPSPGSWCVCVSTGYTLGDPLDKKILTEVPMARKLPLPRGWKRRVKSSIVHILALSH